MTTETKATWQTVQLGDIAEILSSKRIYQSDYVKSGIPFYRSKEIIEKFENKEITTNLFIDKEKFRKIKTKFGVPKENDILVTSVGTLGFPYFVSKNDNFYFKDGNLIWFRNFNKKTQSKFLYYWIQSSIGRGKLLETSIGSSQSAFTISNLKEIEINLPSLDVQKKIAKILSAFDEKIENNNRIIKTLEEMVRSIFKEWFVKFKFSGHEKLKMKSEKLFELGKIVCGKTPSKLNSKYFGGEIPFLKIPDMHNQMFMLKTEDSLTEMGADSQKNKFVPRNSICVSCIATVGLVSITTKDSQTNQQINTIIPKSESYLEFLYLALKIIKNDLVLIGSGGSTTLNINTGTFSNIEVLVPEEDVINKFHKLVNPMFNKIFQIENENQKLTTLRDLLLPKLISGEIRV